VVTSTDGGNFERGLECTPGALVTVRGSPSTITVGVKFWSQVGIDLSDNSKIVPHIYPLIGPRTANAQSSSPNEVSIVTGSSQPTNENFYDPTEVVVKVGDKVTWVNNDISIHNLASGTADEGPTNEFESGIMQASGTFEHTFNNAGSIDYYCTIHPWMTGIVTVT
jgi:plastocyanin